MNTDRYAVAYGLDVSCQPPTLCRLVARGEPQLMPWPPADATAQAAFQSEIRRGEAALAVAVPATQTILRRLVAPFASLRKAEHVWPSLLDMELPFPIEAAQCDFSPAEIRDEKASTLACAIRRSDLDAFLQSLATQGIEPTHGDAEAVALWEEHLFETPPIHANRPVLLIHLALDHVTVLRGTGAHLDSAHVLRTAPETLDSALWAHRLRPLVVAAPANHAGPTAADDASSPAPLTVWWTGPGADSPATLDRLRRALQPVAADLRHETHRAPAAFLSRALARCALTGRGVEFLSPPYAPPARIRRSVRHQRHQLVGILVLSLAILALNATIRQRFRTENDALQQALQASAAQLVSSPIIPGEELLMAQRALDRDRDAWQAVNTARLPSNREIRFLELLQTLANRQVEFSRISFTPAGIEAEGLAPALADVEHVPGWALRATAQRQGSATADRIAFTLKGEWPHEE